MIKDITIGQYYQAESIIHRLDPRVKLMGTLVFIISLFLGMNIWIYAFVTVALAAVIAISKIPLKFMVRGLKSIVILIIISVKRAIIASQILLSNLTLYMMIGLPEL